jgi:hypothetical protein
MLRAKNGRCLLGAIAVLILTGPAAAQLIDIVKFKGIEIPHTLKFEHKILEKGLYDLEILKNPTTTSYYLRFKKNRQDHMPCRGRTLGLQGPGDDANEGLRHPAEAAPKNEEEHRRKSFHLHGRNRHPK